METFFMVMLVLAVVLVSLTLWWVCRMYDELNRTWMSVHQAHLRRHWQERTITAMYQVQCERQLEALQRLSVEVLRLRAQRAQTEDAADWWRGEGQG